MQGRIANASLSRPLARFFRCQDGFLSVVMAILLPAMIMVAGIAIDLSDLNAQRKAVQSQADLAALSGVPNPSTACLQRRSIFPLGSGRKVNRGSAPASSRALVMCQA